MASMFSGNSTLSVDFLSTPTVTKVGDNINNSINDYNLFQYYDNINAHANYYNYYSNQILDNTHKTSKTDQQAYTNSLGYNNTLISPGSAEMVSNPNKMIYADGNPIHTTEKEVQVHNCRTICVTPERNSIQSGVVRNTGQDNDVIDETVHSPASAASGGEEVDSPPVSRYGCKSVRGPNGCKLTKPSQNYIQIISTAILANPGKKLQLHEIYECFENKYPYFKHAKSSSWKNSIRHNLSLNECFIKNGRSDNGKGHFWSIHPACIPDFKKGDFRRRQARRHAKRGSFQQTATASTIANGNTNGMPFSNITQSHMDMVNSTTNYNHAQPTMLPNAFPYLSQVTQPIESYQNQSYGCSGYGSPMATNVHSSTGYSNGFSPYNTYSAVSPERIFKKGMYYPYLQNINDIPLSSAFKNQYSYHGT